MLNRREFSFTGIGAIVVSFGESTELTSTSNRAFILRPFSFSRTVSELAAWATMEGIPVPQPLQRTIDAESARPAVRLESPADERKRAVFLAWFAVGLIAPRHLRRAGYDTLALNCEKQPDLQSAGNAAARAQYTIGRDCLHRTGGGMPALLDVAYATCSHAATAAFYARAADIQTVVETGRCAAHALTSPIFLDEDGSGYRTDPGEATWVWDSLVHAINTAMTIGPDSAHAP